MRGLTRKKRPLEVCWEKINDGILRKEGHRRKKRTTCVSLLAGRNLPQSESEEREEGTQSTPIPVFTTKHKYYPNPCTTKHIMSEQIPASQVLRLPSYFPLKGIKCWTQIDHFKVKKCAIVADAFFTCFDINATEVKKLLFIDQLSRHNIVRYLPCAIQIVLLIKSRANPRDRNLF